MFLKRPELTSGFRPLLLPDESVLLVQDNVGLYEGKYKIATCQKGHAYLTSHRACYVDDGDPRANSLAIDLQDIERHDFQAGFLRSSAKITLYPKHTKNAFESSRPADLPLHQQLARVSFSHSLPGSRSGSPLRASPQQHTTNSTGTWICPICSFSNPIPQGFESRNVSPSFPLPPCLACGIKPPFAVVLKAAISASTCRAAGTNQSNNAPRAVSSNDHGTPIALDGAAQTVACPRCTFHNHSSLPNCELCGSPLPTSRSIVQNSPGPSTREGSPGPQLSNVHLNEDALEDGVKFSFRAGGDKIFYEKLKNAMVQRKWLVQSAPPIPLQMMQSGEPSPRPQSTPVGIAGLEQLGLQRRKQNETVIGSAFSDLEALMASAKEIVALAEKFASESNTDHTSDDDALFSASAAAMGIVAAGKDASGGLTTTPGPSNNSLYISELSRHLAEYLTDSHRGSLLRSSGGIVSLVDLWARFNHARNGVELVSPADFHSAATMWERLNLPVRLRRFRSGLLVVQSRAATDDRVVEQLRTWLESFRPAPSAPLVVAEEEADASSALEYGRGISAQDAARRFGWSVGVAHEELEMAEERGALCREEGIEGCKFWLNFLVGDVDDGDGL